jgi:hypothetical protein
VPVLVPFDRLKLNPLLAKPVIALPAASLTMTVTRTALPEATLGDAK